ncbi:hypothetical protein [Zhongshania arctica]|uniref:Uncharacterized protein n=1 Tax=Zhongshania arctica TaxID=3238302 RepID=A0ABV3TRQ5_9GAMM|tara:strand:- start:36774 stop:37214 length:441 start_codon:yes stop_codon:yes gene_type:complete
MLIASGALLIFFAGVAGFGFLFYLLGEIRLWPFPTIEYQMPGSVKAWRMTHLEGVLGGVIHWIFALLLPLLPFTIKTIRRMSVAMISVGWMFTIASSMDALFTDSRGLAYGGPLTNNIAFFLFYVGILMVMYILLVIAYRSLRASD